MTESEVKSWRIVNPEEPWYTTRLAKEDSVMRGRKLSNHWRDPYLFEDPVSGRWYMYFTAARNDAKKLEMESGELGGANPTQQSSLFEVMVPSMLCNRP